MDGPWSSESEDNKMDKGKGCPKCGSNSGFYANIRGMACYYTDGSPKKTFITGKRVETVRCFNCGYKTAISKLKKEANSE